MYFVSATFALSAAVFCALVSFATALGWGFLLPTFVSVLCLLCGIGVSIFWPIRGVWISGVGALLCGGAAIAFLILETPNADIGNVQGTAFLLGPPSLFLVIMIWHVGAAVRTQRTVERRSSAAKAAVA